MGAGYLKIVINLSILCCMVYPQIIRETSTNNPAEPKEYNPDKAVFDFYPHQNKKAPKQWLIDTNNGVKDEAIRLEETEAGFDLTDEEMQKFKIWPKGVLPYYIDDVSFDKVLRDRLRGFLDSVKALTGIQFLELDKPPTDTQTRWVFFINRRAALECSDYTTKDFTNEGVQKVIVGYDCFSALGRLSGTVLGLVGVPPMHNAPDRNKYIEVVDKNILPDKTELFTILDDKEWLFHDIAYDYSSAGHFHYHQYTDTGNMTIKPKKDINYEVGQKTKFSYVDAWKIRMLYNYISKKKGVKASVSACNQLFLPGAKFGTYEPESDDELKPRAKPNKYMGIETELQPPAPSTNDEAQNNSNEVNQTVTPDNNDTNDKAQNNSNEVNQIVSPDDETRNKENKQNADGNSTRAEKDRLKLKKYIKKRQTKPLSWSKTPFDVPDFSSIENQKLCSCVGCCG